MATDGFDRHVFINCPFDPDYDPILQAMLFCVAYLGFTPRIARERADSAENRLAKITGLIRESRYSIHDLSRSRAKRRGEHSRHNMPFELGIDYGSRHFATDHLATKRFLVLSDKPYDYMKSLSDLSGCDIEAHGGSHEAAVRKVRNWLVNEASAPKRTAPGAILSAYEDFSTWHYEDQLAKGFTSADIEEYPTKELFNAMLSWLAAGQPAPVAMAPPVP